MSRKSVWRAGIVILHPLLVLIYLAWLILPLLDHHVAERTLHHGHLILGGNGVGGEELLFSHRHGYEQPHVHGAEAESHRPGCEERARIDEEPVVVAIRGSSPMTASLFSIAGGLALLTPGPLVLLPPFSRGEPLYLQNVTSSSILPTIPKPPPRLHV